MSVYTICARLHCFKIFWYWSISFKSKHDAVILYGSVVKCLTCNPEILSVSHTGSLGFSWGVSMGKTLQSPRTWIMQAVAAKHLKYCWKLHKTPFNQSINKRLFYLIIQSLVREKCIFEIHSQWNLPWYIASKIYVTPFCYSTTWLCKIVLYARSLKRGKDMINMLVISLLLPFIMSLFS